MKRNNSQILSDTLDLKGKRVIDIGCGEGDLVRLMTRNGAMVSGVECNPKMLKKAQEATPEGNETYIEGVAERLPFENDSVDVVVFFNSLHHVAVENQATALREAARVLRKGGVIYVSEPLAEGPNFELMKPILDETHVRACAYRAVKGAADDAGLVEEREFTYTHPVRHCGFEAYRDRMLTINPQCRAIFEERDAELRADYENLGRKTDGEPEYDQPMRVNLLRA